MTWTHGISMAESAYQEQNDIFARVLTNLQKRLTVLHLYVLPVNFPDSLDIVPPLLCQQSWLLPRMPFTTLMICSL